MNKFTKRRAVIVYRNTDNKKVVVDTIEEAMAITGCTENYIRNSATKPNHYSNRADDWSPMTQRGDLRKKTIKPLYRFEYVQPTLLVAKPLFDADIKEYSFSSYYRAVKTMDCSESTFYKHKKLGIKHIVDKKKRLWSIEWRNQHEN